jgi:hypothetical protein
MGSIVNLPSNQTGGEEGSSEVISLVNLAANLQSGLNAKQISWTNIDWSLFPARPGFPDYTVTHDLRSVTVFAPIAAAVPEFLQATDENGEPLTETIISGGVLTQQEIQVLNSDGESQTEFVITDLLGNALSDEEVLALPGYTLVEVTGYTLNLEGALVATAERVIADNKGVILTSGNTSTLGNFNVQSVPFFVRDAAGVVGNPPVPVNDEFGDQLQEIVLIDTFGNVMSNTAAQPLGFTLQSVPVYINGAKTTELVLANADGVILTSGDTSALSSNLGLESVDFVVREGGVPVIGTFLTPGAETVVPVDALDEFGNKIRIVDFAEDLFLAIGGTDGNDHLRARDYGFPDGTGQQANLTGALMGFSGDDVLYSDHLLTPMLMGGSGDDSYILDAVAGDAFVQIVEYGNDADDSVISHSSEWAFAGDINGQHLILSDASQSDVVVIWDYLVPEARIENFWFDFDGNGVNEHYTFDQFISKIHKGGFWIGSLQSESLGISELTLNDLTQEVSEAVVLSLQIENIRVADSEIALSIARLYQTAFDRIPDIGGLNNWIDHWELDHSSIGAIANEFYVSPEFSQTYGSLDDGEYVNQLYLNVLDRPADAGGFDHWTQELSQGVSNRAEVMVKFSNSLENKINTEVQLSGLTEIAPGDWVV